MNWQKTLLICFIILLAGGAITALIFSTEPTASRSGATQQTAMLVDVTEVNYGSYTPVIKAMGTVEPSQDITLSARVGGQIIERSPLFVPGEYVQEGQTLLKIDSADYQNALQQRKSELQQALADYNIEMGRQRAAQKEYQLFGDTLTKENKALVLRTPQLEAVKSQVHSAQAAVKQAELDLQRTAIKAPFDAHILSRNVNIGSLVAPGDNLGRLVGIDTYWIQATIPVSKLQWLEFPNGVEKGTKVQIRNRTAWANNQYRTGYLHKLIGALENQTRMARVLIEVPDPHANQKDNADSPPLMIGSYVEVSIQAKKLENVIRIDRNYIRDDETVWTMNDGTLQIEKVDIIFRDAEYAYLRSGLDAQDQVVTTNLSTVTEGAPLRVEGSGENPVSSRTDNSSGINN